MAYKVSVEEVKVLSHPNPKADNLELVRIGEQQYVVKKGLYNNDDKAVAVPKNSIVTHPVFIREWGVYLQGKDGNKVGFKLMMGQESEGIVVGEGIFKEITGCDINDFEVGKDISELLGITRYVPPIPDELVDTVEAYSGSLKRIVKHDCKYPIVYESKFVEGDNITITSKLHGTQCNVVLVPGEYTAISSKGLWQDGLVFKQGVDNIYTKAWNNFIRDTNNGPFWVTLSDIVKDNIFAQQVHIIGEVVPAIKGFSYGFTEPTLFIYSIYVNGVYIDLQLLRRLPNVNIVPELYRGVYDKYTLEIANDFAQQAVCPLDGTTLNEGVVLSNGTHNIKFKNEKFMKKHGTFEGS